MKTLRALLFVSLFAVPAFAQSAGNGAAAGDVLRTQDRARDRLQDGSCDGSQKQLRLRDLAGSQVRSQARGTAGQRGGGARLGR